MPGSSTALSQIYIGAAYNGTPQLADFEAQEWQVVGAVTDLGSFGAKSKSMSSVWITDNQTHKYKGSTDSGNIELVVERNPFDAGQIGLIAAEASTSAYLFKIVLNDSPTPTGTGSIYYFNAILTSAENKLGKADTVIETTFGLDITGQILPVLATATVVFDPVAGALPAATHAVPYTTTIEADGGLGVVTYSVTTGTLPSALTLNAATGVISGTPAAAGSATFSITASFAEAGSAIVAYTLTID